LSTDATGRQINLTLGDLPTRRLPRIWAWRQLAKVGQHEQAPTVASQAAAVARSIISPGGEQAQALAVAARG